jgi:hypothetical protein
METIHVIWTIVMAVWVAAAATGIYLARETHGD